MAAPDILRNKSNKKVCIYGEKCYRKNPIHFDEFSHPHLERIYDKGRDPVTNEYIIPDELFMSVEVIELQLKLLEKLDPKSAGTNNSKVPKESATTSTTGATGGGHRSGFKNDDDNQAGGSKDNDKNQSQAQAQLTPTKDKVTSNNKFQGTPNRDKDILQTNVSIGYTLGSTTEKSIAVATISNTTKPSEKRTSVVANLTIGSTGSTDTNTSNLSKKQKISRNIKDYIPVVVEKGQMAAKLERAAPYNMFLTAITDCKLTHHEPLTVTLQEILDESLGEIESTVQINFMVDIGWLLGHYYFAGILSTPLLVLYGDDTPELRSISNHQPHVTAVKVNMPMPFATSHAKIMILCYKDGSMRLVISTANLYEDDWHNRTQGVWISPKLPALPEDADTAAGESPTNFKEDFMLYLNEYKISKLQPCIARIRKTDFSAINVFFIGSVPGGFRESARGHLWGHARLGGLLHKHSAEIEDKIPVVCQSSSIGSLGANLLIWVQQNFVNSLRKHSNHKGLRLFPAFKMIYPSFNNVQNSHDDMLGGGCLPYTRSVNNKQAWLKTYLHQWVSKARHRSHAMPHIKTYTRFSVEKQCVYWFVLTSANLSKAAWGAFNSAPGNIQPNLRIFNYEAGVLFLPKFVIGEDTFPLGTVRDGIPPFPMPYDVPLTPYGPDDKPFLMDYLHELH